MSLPNNCQEKTGFLILHRCKNTADAQCSVCGKYVCSRHTHIRASAPVCEGCFKKTAPEEYQNYVASRGGYTGYHGYTPFIYTRYRDSDYNIFDREKAGTFHEDAGES